MDSPPTSPLITSSACGSRRGYSLLVFPVDLRLLQLVRIVDVDGLTFRIEIDRSDAALAVAVPCCFGASKGQIHFGADGGRVDVGDAGIQVANCRKSLVDVLRVKRGGQAVLDSIRDFDRVFEVVARND